MYWMHYFYSPLSLFPPLQPSLAGVHLPKKKFSSLFHFSLFYHSSCQTHSPTNKKALKKLGQIWPEFSNSALLVLPLLYKKISCILIYFLFRLLSRYLHISKVKFGGLSLQIYVCFSRIQAKFVQSFRGFFYIIYMHYNS